MTLSWRCDSVENIQKVIGDPCLRQLENKVPLPIQSPRQVVILFLFPIFSLFILLPNISDFLLSLLPIARS